MPGVRIDRTAYLRSALERYCTSEQIDRAVEHSPAAAGISPDVITRAANTAITYETARVTGVSTLAGVPGGLAMVGTVPADLVQYFGHMLRIAQKLAYLYSWPDLFGGNKDLDEATEGILTLFIGVMMGVQLAQAGVSRVANMIAAQLLKTLPQKALTKGILFPIVKKVAAQLGVKMSVRMFSSGVAKAVPIAGAILSGGFTLGTFLPMAKRLQKHLASLAVTKPDHGVPASAAMVALDMKDIEVASDLVSDFDLESDPETDRSR